MSDSLQLALRESKISNGKSLREFFADYTLEREELDPFSAAIRHRISDFCLREGKVIRGFLVSCGAALAQETSQKETLSQEKVRALMMFVELTQKRFLMADDVADRDELRNEEPAFHTLWEADLKKTEKYKHVSDSEKVHFSRSFTEVAGIWLQHMTWQLLETVDFSEFERKKIQKIADQYLYEMTVAGWYLLFDQGLEELTAEVSEERFLRGLEYVTSGYSCIGPLLLGATTGQNSTALEKTLTAYGQALGILFQITDDIIGLFGDPAVTGKPVGGDVREGKKTLLIQYAFRAATAQQKKTLQKLIGKKDISEAEVEHVREIVRTTGAEEKTRAKANEYAQMGKDAISHLEESETKTLLLDLIDFIATRDR